MQPCTCSSRASPKQRFSEAAVGFEIARATACQVAKSLSDTLLSNVDMLHRLRYGRIGSIAPPYLWIFELLAVVIELGGIITVLLTVALGDLSRDLFIQFEIFGYAFATVISMGWVPRFKRNLPTSGITIGRT
jgi:hypothetical protein